MVTQQHNTPPHDSHHPQAEAELFQAILQPTPPYPWEPQEPGAEVYFSEIESTAIRSAGEEALAASNLAYQRLLLCRVQAYLQERFTTLPQTLVESILYQATQIPHQSQSLAERLVQSVQGYFAQWSEEDLSVLARPYAYAMRSPLPPQISERDWDTLPELEQVRWGLEVARIVLGAIDQD